jgi:hypothetical protein
MGLTKSVNDTIVLLEANLKMAEEEKATTGELSNGTLDTLRLGVGVLHAAVDEIQMQFDRQNHIFRSQYFTEFLGMFRMLITAERAILEYIECRGQSSPSADDVLAYCEAVIKLEDPRA